MDRRTAPPSHCKIYTVFGRRKSGTVQLLPDQTAGSYIITVVSTGNVLCPGQHEPKARVPLPNQASRG